MADPRGDTLALAAPKGEPSRTSVVFTTSSTSGLSTTTRSKGCASAVERPKPAPAQPTSSGCGLGWRAAASRRLLGACLLYPIFPASHDNLTFPVTGLPEGPGSSSSGLRDQLCSLVASLASFGRQQGARRADKPLGVASALTGCFGFLLAYWLARRACLGGVQACKMLMSPSAANHLPTWGQGHAPQKKACWLAIR